MSWWAEINNENIVLRVLVGNENDPTGDCGYSWLINNLGGTWIETYQNGNRKQFAGVGFTYNPIADVFIEPQTFPSWILNENYDWQAPTPKPDGKCYWDEKTLNWIKID